ncbi:MAG: DUF5781 family protein [Halobacteriaceae archaeon]
MELSVQGPGPAAPFLSAQDRFETEHDLTHPVTVRVRTDPDERTWAAHHEDRHVLNISQQAASSAMARELALHEFAHMRRHEQAHPSHTQSTEEALYLALAGRSVERRTIPHCYQIANHAKDIYADDITLSVGPSEKLTAFLESRLAAAVADRPAPSRPAGQRLTAASDPEMTAVNAAFAVALLRRHDALPTDHRILDLAHAAAEDAPSVDVDWFIEEFSSLAADPDESTYRRALAALLTEYAETTEPPAAD